MKIAVAHLKSMSPYSQGKHISAEKLDKESHNDYEKRTWRERLHVNKDGNVLIPPMSLKLCLSEAAKFLSMQIKGKGKATYTKHFEAGVMVTDEIVLPIKRDEVASEELYVPSDGVRGSGKRVTKWFPLISEWEGRAKFYVLDETITRDVFEYHLNQAGLFIGIGRFRPRNNGYYGRFNVESLEWLDGGLK